MNTVDFIFSLYGYVLFPCRKQHKKHPLEGGYEVAAAIKSPPTAKDNSHYTTLDTKVMGQAGEKDSSHYTTLDTNATGQAGEEETDEREEKDIEKSEENDNYRNEEGSLQTHTSMLILSEHGYVIYRHCVRTTTIHKSFSLNP